MTDQALKQSSAATTASLGRPFDASAGLAGHDRLRRLLPDATSTALTQTVLNIPSDLLPAATWSSASRAPPVHPSEALPGTVPDQLVNFYKAAENAQPQFDPEGFVADLVYLRSYFLWSAIRPYIVPPMAVPMSAALKARGGRLLARIHPDTKGTAMCGMHRLRVPALSAPLIRTPPGSARPKADRPDRRAPQRDHDRDPGPHPAITRLSPATGPLAGGNTVAIYGSGFAPDATVKFVRARLGHGDVVSPGELKAVAPAASAGKVDVVVHTPAGYSPVVAGTPTPTRRPLHPRAPHTAASA